MSRSALERTYACTGKKRFTSFSRAQKIAHHQAQRHHAKFTAYACELCGGFHIGGTLGDPRRCADGRQRFMVYACQESGPETLVGWSNSPDGGGVARLIEGERGWKVTRVIERKRRAA
jgi:hypothetical protein